MIGVIVFFSLKGTKQIASLIQGFIPSNKMPAHPPKKEESNPDSNVRSINKGVEPGHNDELLSDISLNNADFDEAKSKDDRTYLSIYWSLLKNKQLFIFTFYTNNDGNIRVVKIGLFILFVSFYFAYTALFFNDSIMRNIYIYKGNTNAAIHVPNIILSSLCCLIMSLIVRFVSLNERDISKIIQSPKDERRKLANNLSKIAKIKLFILYAVSGLLICLCWYYVAAFCAVFKNSQGHYFTNALIAFIVCN
jgi:hypothetical protein